MTGFKGKRKRGLTLTLYKKPFLYRLPVSPPRKRTETTPNLKSPSIRTPSLLRKSLSISKYYILSNGLPHLFGATFLLLKLLLVGNILLEVIIGGPLTNENVLTLSAIISLTHCNQNTYCHICKPVLSQWWFEVRGG